MVLSHACISFYKFISFLSVYIVITVTMLCKRQPSWFKAVMVYFVQGIWWTFWPIKSTNICCVITSSVIWCTSYDFFHLQFGDEVAKTGDRSRCGADVPSRRLGIAYTMPKSHQRKKKREKKAYVFLFSLFSWTTTYSILLLHVRFTHLAECVTSYTIHNRHLDFYCGSLTCLIPFLSVSYPLSFITYSHKPQNLHNYSQVVIACDCGVR